MAGHRRRWSQRRLVQNYLIFIVVAPIMGFVLGFGLMITILSLLFQHRSPRQVDKLSTSLQLVSAAAYSLGHGGNDTEKTMGIVAGALYTAGIMSHDDFAANWENGTGPSSWLLTRDCARHLLAGGARSRHGFEDLVSYGP